MTHATRRERGEFADVAAWVEPAPGRTPVNREQLLREAMALVEDGGFDGLTMRRLAARLGVQAPSLYNHLRDKAELLALLADAISGEVREIDPERPWREQLEAVARDYRRVLLAHRDGARVLAATPPLGPHRLQAIEQVLALFCRAGFAAADAVDAAFVFNSYVVGFVLDETQAQLGGDLSAAELQEQARRWYGALPPERYPRLIAMADYLFDASLARRFEFGITTLLDGLELRLTRRGPS
ncbi:MAG: TetR/AcrR family transcriptional regulator C-terminal domain-containing protein [Dehalococcoidia bacterium]